MQDLASVMGDAMQLMRSGDLRAATQIIQRGLRNRPSDTPAFSTGLGRGITLDGEHRTVRDDAFDVPPTPTPRSDQTDKPDIEQDVFSAHEFSGTQGTLAYKLFVPRGVGSGAPLLVMLHGCTQSPDDFARGTRMNALAQQHGYIVLYPAQTSAKNPGKCWNWFREADQQRGGGEAALIAALTRHVIDRHDIDPRRVYAAGLSAGGAMAAVLGATYGDVYAAIGVHSGLPFGAARDMASAFAAMKSGRAAVETIRGIPAIVFHGDRDSTVDACNGDALIAQFTSGKAEQPATVERGSSPGGRRYTRALYRDADGVVGGEHWQVHGAGHAWFGGDSSGTYTDPAGPDASAHMLRFFASVVRPVIN